jgi:membrane protein required for colicin V production
MTWADWNWVDWLLIGFLAISVLYGFAEGFIRIGIGFAALIFGFLFASWFHGIAGGWLAPYVESKALVSLVGFLIILFATLALGYLIAAIVQRIFRIVGLTWLDRLAGGFLGAVRGVLVLAIVALLISAFLPKRMPAAVSRSQLAPYLFGMSRVLSEITPYEIKNGFEQSYQEFTVLLEALKKHKELPVPRQ